MLKRPAISIIIPMYNAEKYIAECLESILEQTFQNFEVIVVDDCSTDNSVAIVNDYAQKFDGRLILTKTEKNSGSAGEPRNIGLNASSGQYIYFVDSDDFIAKNALKILYIAVSEYNADVIYTPTYYSYDNNGNINCMVDRESKIQKNGLEGKPTLTIADPNKNLNQLLFKGDFRNLCTKFVRRDFLLENGIAFPKNISQGEDFIWVICVYCHSKRFLRLPIPLYFYRINDQSISRRKRPVQEQILYWSSSFATWLKHLNEISNGIKILREHPYYCYAAANTHFNYCLNCIKEERQNISNFDLYEILYREFAKRNDSSDLMMPFFLSVIDAYKKHFAILQQRIYELEGKE